MPNKEQLAKRIYNYLVEYQLAQLLDPQGLADGLAEWMLTAPVIEQDMTQYLLPKATYRSGLRVIDETTGQHLITLLLERTKLMTDGDWLQMQNFLWTVLGRAILADRDLQRVLRAGGIQIYTEDVFNPGRGGDLAV